MPMAYAKNGSTMIGTGNNNKAVISTKGKRIGQKLNTHYRLLSKSHCPWKIDEKEDSSSRGDPNIR